MNTKVLFYLKKFQEAQDSEITDLLIEAMKALPCYKVGYNLKDKRAYITKDVRATLAHRIKESGIMQKDVAELLGMHRTALTDYLNEKRNIPYDNLSQLLALFDEPCIESSELKKFVEFYEKSEIEFDDSGFFNIRTGDQYLNEDVIREYKGK